MEERYIYLDHHATTPADPRVVEAMMPYFTQHFGNPASLAHRYGWIAKEAVESARRKVAALIGARPAEIVFTSGATESNNLALQGAADAFGTPGHIITTAVEHACVLGACRALERRGWSVTVLPVDRFGMVDPRSVLGAIRPETRIVSVMTANNEVGTLQPVEEIGRLCDERGVLFHTDATQSAGRLAVHVEALRAGLLSFSAHKMYGPKGIGALYVRSRRPRVGIGPMLHGAGHEHGLRSGTLNVPAIVGFGVAAELAGKGMAEEAERLSSLRDELQRRLTALEGTSVNGHPERRLPNNLSLTVEGVTAERLITAMGNVAASAGAACLTEETDGRRLSHVLAALGLTEERIAGTVRFGLGRGTTVEEITEAAERFTAAVRQLRTLSLEHAV